MSFNHKKYDNATTSRFRLIHRNGSRAGLTLVELAMVIFALSILFSILFGLFYNISQVANEGRQSIIEKKNAILALEVIRSSLNRTFYFKNEKRLVFFGQTFGETTDRKDTLTFAAVHPGSELSGIPSVREVSFYTKQSNDSSRWTLMKREDAPVDHKPGEGGAHYVLLENIQSLVFRYSGDGVTWEDTWDSRKKKEIPRLIQIRFVAVIDGKEQVFESLSNPGVFAIEKEGFLN